jgi:hypothetical protein
MSQVTEQHTTLRVPYQFRGPAGSANGGYMCGRIAGYLDAPVTVTLHRPPPLDTPLTVEAGGDGSVRVLDGGALVAEAASGRESPPLHVPEAAMTAQAPQRRSPYFEHPVFPECFVCGIRRSPQQGLRIFPGRVPGRNVWAARWRPHPLVVDADLTVRPEIVWAALDCPSGIAAGEAADLAADSAIVLGRMTATVATLPASRDDCRVVAWPIGRDGRKLTAGSALLRQGEVLAVARTLWITVPRPGMAS